MVIGTQLRDRVAHFLGAIGEAKNIQDPGCIIDHVAGGR
jgi:hypothetical protein